MEEIRSFLSQWLIEHDIRPGPVGLVEIDKILMLAYIKGEIAGIKDTIKKLS